MSKTGLFTGIVAFLLSFSPPVGLIVGILGAILCTETEQDRSKLAMTFNIVAIISSIVTLLYWQNIF